MTERMMAAMDHPFVDAIGHLTGRLILRREPYAIDIELGGGSKRPGPGRCSRSTPIRTGGTSRTPTCWVGGGGRGDDRDRPDAQRPHPGRDPVRHATARRGWLTKDNVANTAKTLEAQLAKLRKRARAARRR